MNKLILALSAALLWTLLATTETHALSLQVAPLEYKTQLKTGEKKRGTVDISNSSSLRVRVKSSVQAFRQVDNNGTLQFYDSEQLSAGVKLDLDEFELGPREAVRMYFELDGTKLPTGDVFGAIFFTLDPAQPRAGVGQTVRVGTVLSLVNGTPGSRSADITALAVPNFQLDSTVNGSYTIKNTANPASATGFYPTVSIASWPFGKTQKQTGRLVFAGRTRDNTFSFQTPPFGLYKVSVSYGSSQKSSWLFVAHPLTLLAIIVSVLIVAKIRHLRQRTHTSDSVV